MGTVGSAETVETGVGTLKRKLSKRPECSWITNESAILTLAWGLFKLFHLLYWINYVKSYQICNYRTNKNSTCVLHLCVFNRLLMSSSVILKSVVVIWRKSWMFYICSSQIMIYIISVMKCWKCALYSFWLKGTNFKYMSIGEKDKLKPLKGLNWRLSHLC